MLYINDHISDFDLDEAIAALPQQRREKVLAFKSERDRRLSVTAYHLLREALWQEFGISEPPVFGYYEGGKPFLADWPEIHFSLSHCRQAAVCAVALHPVGVDIETIRPFSEELAKRVLNADELHQVITSANPSTAFIRLWTMKESLLKLTGEGIRHALTDVLSRPTHFHTVVNSQAGYIYTLAEDEQEP